MNTVQPIKDGELIKQMARYLKDKSYRDYIMFLFGLHSGLRISDILKLKIKDVKCDYIYLHEKKTKKEKRFIIHPDIKKDLKHFIKGKEDNEFLFRSRQGTNKPITRSRAYEILNDLAKEFKIDRIGTHSMRKTFGYFIYQQSKDLAVLKDIFNHSDESTTLRYIGMVDDTKDDIIKKLKIMK